MDRDVTVVEDVRGLVNTSPRHNITCIPAVCLLQQVTVYTSNLDLYWKAF